MIGHTRSQLVEKAAWRFQQEALERRGQVSLRPPRVIALSRQLGSGGSRIAAIVGERLQWHVWDREILDVMASESQLHLQARMLESLDERAQNDVDALAESLLGGVDKHVYQYLLVKAILIIAQHDAIIVGRGAHLTLPGALKVRIVAPFDSRVKSVAQREGLSEEAARKRVRACDREREVFLRDLTRRLGRGTSANQRGIEYDLVINTDAVGVQGAASLLLMAAQQTFGLEPGEALAA